MEIIKKKVSACVLASECPLLSQCKVGNEEVTVDVFENEEGGEG